MRRRRSPANVRYPGVDKGRTTAAEIAVRPHQLASPREPQRNGPGGLVDRGRSPASLPALGAEEARASHSSKTARHPQLKFGKYVS
jgi:hypothetical protein